MLCLTGTFHCEQTAPAGADAQREEEINLYCGLKLCGTRGHPWIPNSLYETLRGATWVPGAPALSPHSGAPPLPGHVMPGENLDIAKREIISLI